MRILKKIKNIPKRFIMDKHQKLFIRHNKRVWEEWKVIETGNEILIEFYPVPINLLLWSYLSNILGKKYGAKIFSFSAKGRIENGVLHKIFSSFNTQKHITEILTRGQLEERNSEVNRILSEIKEKKDILQIKVRNFDIGIEIYSTYLVRFNKPTVSLKKSDLKYLRQIMIDAITKVIFWDDYFIKHYVKAVLTSHFCYNINIVIKVARKYKVNTYFPFYIGSTIKVIDRDCYYGKYFFQYREMFNKLTEQEKIAGLKWAETQMKTWFTGKSISNMYYVKNSPFLSDRGGVSNRVLEINDKIKVIIFLHCFYDNPYGWGEPLFPDFYEWLVFLGEISERTDYDWYIKMHPDYRDGEMQVLNDFVKRYPRIKIIPIGTTHYQLIQEGIQFALTVYGTIGREFPLFGVQVINAGYNPHIAYDFNWHPKTIDEYEKMLMNLESLKKDINPQDIYEYFYIHNKYGSGQYFNIDIPDDKIQLISAVALKARVNRNTVKNILYSLFLEKFTTREHEKIINIMTESITKIDA